MAKRSVVKERRRNEAHRARIDKLPKLAEGTQFHIKRNGDVEPCRLIEGNCVLGDDTEHYNTYDEAKLVADKMIKDNPQIAKIPEPPMEGLFYQLLVDQFGETEGWFSTYNGDIVPQHDIDEIIQDGITYKEFIERWDVGLVTNDYALSVGSENGEDTVTDRFGMAMNGSVVFDKDTKVEYRLHTTYHLDSMGREIVDYISVDGYVGGKWAEEHTSFLPAGTWIDRESKPWSILEDE